MKLKILKWSFFFFCIAAFIFLLLPFLETTPPPTPAQLKAQPQIITANPLAAIAKRLAGIWGRQPERKPHLSSAQEAVNTNKQLSPNDSLIMARADAEPPAFSDPADLQSSSIPLPTPQEADYGNATFHTDNGQWVLVRQTAPQSGQPGMHEVNVHENPYDRYVKQERSLRAVPQEGKTEIPDSKWARLVRPVKKFLGLDTPTPVGASPVQVAREGDTMHSLTDTAQQATEIKQPIGPDRLPLPDITPMEWEQMTPYEREQHQIAHFSELMNGTRSVGDAAEILANTKYAQPKDEETARQKEGYKRGLTEEGKEKIKEGIFRTMQARAQGKEPVDELAYMVGCKSTSLPDTSGVCHVAPEGKGTRTPPMPQNIIKREQDKNAALFYQSTHYVFPKGLPLTPVLGPTTPETIEQMSGPTQQTQDAAEIYQFLYQYNNCASQTCYWVASSNQTDPQLSDAISMANATLKPDPLNTYPTYKQAFIAYKLAQLGDQSSKEQLERARKAAEKQFEHNSVHYVPYTTQLMRDTQEQKNTVFYVDDVAQAPHVATDINSVFFAYGKEPLTKAQSSIEAGKLITQSIVQNAEDNKKEIQSVNRPMYKETVRENVQHKLEELDQQKKQNKDKKGKK